MPVYIGDYIKDTMGLSAKEHGCYFLLLMNYWVEGYLNDDIEELLIVCRLQADEKRVLEKILKKFFQHQNGHYIQKRIEEEIRKAHNIRDRNQKNSASRWSNTKSVPNKSQKNTKSVRKRCSSPSPSPSPSSSQSLIHKTDSPTSSAGDNTHREKEKDKEKDKRIKVLIDYYHDAFVHRTKQKPTITGQWGRNLKLLLRAHTEDTVKRVIDTFFAYDKRTRFSFSDFMRTFDNLLQRATGQLKESQYPKARCPYCDEILPKHKEDCVSQEGSRK